MIIKRVVVWFSCGITSTVAAKIVVDKYKDSNIPVVVAYCDTGSEHPDNYRYIEDVEDWIRVPILRLKSEKYNNIWDVFDLTGYLVGIAGARCTTELKKKVRESFENLDTDLQVFGFHYGETVRKNKFLTNNPLGQFEFPLIDQKLTKQDCLGIVSGAGIDIPMMYKLGYKNNNCVGCVKGAKGYWNKIRVDFPDVFQKMAEQERKMGVAINSKTKKGVMTRIYLDELDPNDGTYSSELDFECGIWCPLDEPAKDKFDDGK